MIVREKTFERERKTEKEKRKRNEACNVIFNNVAF